MAQVAITGLPGGGKSLVGTHQLHQLLMSDTRRLVISLPIYQGRTWEYIRQRYGADVDMGRITIISKEQAATFYCYRGDGIVAPLPKSRREGGDGCIDYANSVRTRQAEPGVVVEEPCNALLAGGVIYIIDEAHIPLAAERWEANKDAGLFYLSQHRKLNDDVYFITQHVSQIHKSLLVLTAEFWRVTNYGSRIPFGIRLPSVFVVDVFTKPPSLLGTIIDTRHLTLDPEGLCSTYNTAAGVGLSGTLADTQRKKKGLPWQVGILLVVLLCLGLYAIPVVGGRLFKAHGAAKRDEARVKLTNAVPTLAMPPLAQPAPVVRAPAPPAPLPVNPAGVKIAAIDAVAPVRVKWMVRKGDRVALGMTDGDTFTVGDGRLVILGKFAVLDGNRVFRLPD